MHDHYFKQLNHDLKIAGTGLPQLIIDEKVLMQNIDFIKHSLKKASHLRPRFVVKSLGCMQLIQLIAQQLETQSFMVFHLPHIKQILDIFPQADVLLGKPMPVTALRTFVAEKNEDLIHQIQWLVDTVERVEQYLNIAQQFNLKLRLNIEIDVGLHRGGVETMSQLDEICQLIARNLSHLSLSGFMGYDAHVSKIPEIIKKAITAYTESQEIYKSYIEYLGSNFPSLFHDKLCFNGGGSPSFDLHLKHSVCNDVSFGSMLLKPSDFDIDSLSNLQPALWIATPVLKVLKSIKIPSMSVLNRLPRNRYAVFIYGGYWLGKCVYPQGTHPHFLYGRSSNQELLSVKNTHQLNVDDYVFIRPTQSEAIIQQFKSTYFYSQDALVEKFEECQNFIE